MEGRIHPYISPAAKEDYSLKGSVSLTPESPRSSQADYSGRSQREVWYRSENYFCNMKTKARTEDFLNVGTKPHGKSVVVLPDEVYCPKPNFRADPCSGILCTEDTHERAVEPGMVMRTARRQRLI